MNMNTRKIAMEYRLTHWAQIVHKCKESGLSIKAYCEQEGFHANIYYYWQRKLREAAYDYISEPAIPKGTNIVPQGFMEVKIREQQTQLACMEAGHQIRIEAAGVQITASSVYPVDRLAALLKELTRP